MKRYIFFSFLTISAALVCDQLPEGIQNRSEWAFTSGVFQEQPVVPASLEDHTSNQNPYINPDTLPQTIANGSLITVESGGQSYKVQIGDQGYSIPDTKGITITNSGNKAVHIYLNHSSGSEKKDLIHVVDRNLNPGKSFSLDDNQNVSEIKITDAN